MRTIRDGDRVRTPDGPGTVFDIRGGIGAPPMVQVELDTGESRGYVALDVSPEYDIHPNQDQLLEGE